MVCTLGGYSELILGNWLSAFYFTFFSYGGHGYLPETCGSPSWEELLILLSCHLLAVPIMFAKHPPNSHRTGGLDTAPESR